MPYCPASRQEWQYHLKRDTVTLPMNSKVTVSAYCPHSQTRILICLPRNAPLPPICCFMVPI